MKNILKSFFITLFPTVTLWVFVSTIIDLSTEFFRLNTLGNFISSVTILLFFARLFLKSTARTSVYLAPFSMSIGIGFILNLIPSNTENGITLLFNSSLLTSWLLYLFWYSTFGIRKSKQLEIGKKLPEFSLEDTSKNRVNSYSFLGKTTVYIFYRGNWCPLCMAQIKEIAASYKALELRGVKVFLVSPQSERQSQKLAKQFDAPMTFMVDKNLKAAKQLGIMHESGTPVGMKGYDSDTVMPTAILTDKTGKIIFADLTDNYRVRPEPKTFINILDNQPT